MTNLDAAIIHGLKEFIDTIEALRCTNKDTLKVHYSWEEFSTASAVKSECDFFMVKDGYGLGYSL